MQGHRTEYGDEQHVARRVCVAGEHASESHAWVSTPLSTWQQGRARPDGQTFLIRLQSRGDDHHDFEDLRHVPQKKDHLCDYVLDHCYNRAVHWRDTLAAILRNLSKLVGHSYGSGTNVSDLTRRILDDSATERNTVPSERPSPALCTICRSHVHRKVAMPCRWVGACRRRRLS